MSSMKLHLLNAHGALTEHRNFLERCLESTYQKAMARLKLPALDVVVKLGAQVIPEKGHLGYCPEPGVVYIIVDPENPAFCRNTHQSLERMFAHELHHAARWTGPGYGVTLGEAIVSEGLAGHFALEIFGGEPEPWEVLSVNEIHPYHVMLADNWKCKNYDHNAWFYGTGLLPKWLGYSLAFNLIADYFQAHPDQSASRLVLVDAEEFQASQPNLDFPW